MTHVNNREAFEIFVSAYYDQMKAQDEETIDFSQCIKHKGQ